MHDNEHTTPAPRRARQPLQPSRRALSALIEGARTAAAIATEANVGRELVRELERQGLVALDGVSRRGVHRRLKITAAGMRELGHVAPWEGRR